MGKFTVICEDQQSSGILVQPSCRKKSAAAERRRQQIQNRPAFSVQFHPEAAGGPRDTGFLFDRFLDLMKEAM